MARQKSEPSEVDMTPMIDVVFQLIIFFIVTIKMDDTSNPDITLPEAKDAPILEASQVPPLIIEVAEKGRISMSNAQLSIPQLRGILTRRYNKKGEFPVLIRADKDTPHHLVKRVMDVCTESNLWRINFIATKQDMTP